MKRVKAFNKPLYLTIILFLIISLFNISYPGFAQFPEPTPASGASITLLSSAAGKSMGDFVALGTASRPCSASDSISCTIPPVHWEIEKPLPAAVYGVAVASDGRYVYAAGGYYDTAVNHFARYDPLANLWTTLASPPVTVRNALAVYAEGKIYIFGGEQTDHIIISNVQIYTIATGLWSGGAAMPGVRQQMGGGYYNGKIYVAGGVDTNLFTPTNQTWEYTIAANSWAAKASLPISLGGPGSGVSNGYLYILGGRDVNNAALNTTFRYSIAANTWATGANLLTPVNLPGSVVYNDRIWLFGGGAPFLANDALTPQSVNTVNITQIFDPATDTWQYGPAQNVARSLQAGAAAGNKIISIAGFATSAASNTVEVITQERLKILILYADSHTIPNKLRFALIQQPGVLQVDMLDGQTLTPTLPQLENYNIIIPFSNSSFASATTLGNVLADYQDNGGTVVEFAYNWYTGFNIQGRWQSEGYSPYVLTGTYKSQDANLGANISTHPLMKNVSSLSAHGRLELTKATGAILVAAWDDGQPLVATKGRAVGINAYPGDYSGVWSGDFARVVVNAGNWQWQGNETCDRLVCPRSTTIQGAIADSDATQPGHLYKDEPQGTCLLPQTCSVYAGDSNMRHFDAYQFVNNNISAQCVTVALDAGSCTGTGHWVQSSAYLGSYEPSNLCANYLADIGGSPNPAKSYSFTVPAWQSYTVVVNENEPNTFCPSYSLKVTANNCSIKHVFSPLIRSKSP